MVEQPVQRRTVLTRPEGLTRIFGFQKSRLLARINNKIRFTNSWFLLLMRSNWLSNWPAMTLDTSQVSALICNPVWSHDQKACSIYDLDV